MLITNHWPYNNKVQYFDTPRIIVDAIQVIVTRGNSVLTKEITLNIIQNSGWRTILRCLWIIPQDEGYMPTMRPCEPS